MPQIIDAQLFTNNAVSLLAAPITSSALTFTVMAGHGAKFPQPVGDGSDWFLITLESQDAQDREIINVIGRTGDVFTIHPMGRGNEGTTAQAWSATSGNDTLVDLRLTAESIRRLSNAYSTASYPDVASTGDALDKLFSLFTLSGTSLYDQPYTFDDSTCKVTLEQAYQPGSVRMFVGGLRQKSGEDYTESGEMELTMSFTFSNAMIAEGQTLVIDFIPA
jgi:hypothetical protein